MTGPVWIGQSARAVSAFCDAPGRHRSIRCKPHQRFLEVLESTGFKQGDEVLSGGPGGQVTDAVRFRKKQMRVKSVDFSCSTPPNKPGHQATGAFMFTDLCQ